MCVSCATIHVVILCRQRRRECHPDKHRYFPEDGRKALTELSKCVTKARDALSVPVDREEPFWDILQEFARELYLWLDVQCNQVLYTLKAKIRRLLAGFR